MRSYEEQEKRAYEKAKKIIAESNHRKAIIRRSAAFIAGTAAVLAIGIFTNAMNAPHMPSSENSGIVTEPKTVSNASESAETTSVMQKNTTSSAVMTTETAISATGTTKVISSAKTIVTTAPATVSTAETEVHTEPFETQASEEEPQVTTEGTKRTKAPRTSSRLKSIDATWTEVVPLEPEQNVHKSPMLKMFDSDEIYNNTDIIFDGTIIGSTEYEVNITHENGYSSANRVTVLDVTVDYVYYGETDKDIVKVVWKAPLSEQYSSWWQKPIVIGSEYIFMLQELSEEYPDYSLAYRFADYELLASRWYLIPVYGDISGIYYEYFKDNEEAEALSIPKENISDVLPDHMRNYNSDKFFYKDDLIELLKKFFE